jgi:hypothetical protein
VNWQKEIDLQQLRTRWDLDPSGFFIIKDSYHKSKIGKRVNGSYDKDGYLRVWFGNSIVHIHRLAWFYVHGSCPPMLDHINGNRTDNRIENLRPADAYINNGNRQKHRDGIPPNVNYHKRDKAWYVSIWLEKRYKYVGKFETLEEAIAARNAAIARLRL